MVCKNNPDIFCYVCGEYCVARERKRITESFKGIYQQYFGIGLRCGANVKYAPSVVCSKCYRSLLKWNQGQIDYIEYAFPMMWSPMEKHIADECYFCKVEVFGDNRRTKSIINYPNLDTARRPIHRRPGMALPMRTVARRHVQNPTLLAEGQSSPCVPSTSADSNSAPSKRVDCEHGVFTKEE